MSTLTPEQLQAVRLLANGRTHTEIASELGIATKTVQRWTKKPEFNQAVQNVQSKVVERTIETTAESIHERVQALVPSAVTLLQTIIQDSKANPNHRLRAADILGNWAGLKQATVLKADSQPEENLKGYLEYLKDKSNGNGHTPSQH